MRIEEVIFKKFRNKIVVYNANNKDEMLFKPDDALDIIDELERLHAIILGLDLWMYKNGTYKEVNSTSWDNINSVKNASEKTIKAARDLIKKNLLRNEEYISFVLEEKYLNSTV